MTDEKLYPLCEVAEMTGLSERSLSDAARAKRMPHFKIHGRRYMNMTQIREYLAACLVQPHVEQPTRRERMVQELKQGIQARAANARYKSGPATA